MRLSTALPRLAVVVVVLLLATTAATYAAQGGGTPVVPTAVPTPTAPKELVVPDVGRQAYVFAKGILEEAGFAWQVQGSVRGFAANHVVTQHPAPGTRVVDTGTPLVTLTLARNGSYGQDGVAEDASPYRGTPVRLVGVAAEKKPVAAPKPAEPAAPKPAAAPEAVPAKPAMKKKTSYPQKRPAAFAVAGAPAEPLDEMPLVDRVKQLNAWLTKHPKPSNANVNHWLYQHQWVVTGARFGWWQGAEALRQLIRVDERVQKMWGVGAQSAELARNVLASVDAQSA